MKTFFVILVLLLIIGYGAMMLGVIGVILFTVGVVAAIIAMLIVQNDRQERIEAKLDKLLAARENGGEALGEEKPSEGLKELPLCKEMLEDDNA